MGAKRDAVVLNASYSYHIVHPEVSPVEARKIIEETIDSGKAKNLLEEFAAATRED
jgi:anthranilate phosphoribosyltransferase